MRRKYFLLFSSNSFLLFAMNPVLVRICILSLPGLEGPLIRELGLKYPCSEFIFSDVFQFYSPVFFSPKDFLLFPLIVLALSR